MREMQPMTLADIAVGRPAAPRLRVVLRRLFVGGGANLRRLLGERGTQVS